MNTQLPFPPDPFALICAIVAGLLLASSVFSEIAGWLTF